MVVPERVVEEEDGKAEKEEGTEPSTPEPKSGLYGNMADVLFGKGKLTGLQKQVIMLTVTLCSIHPTLC